MKFEGWGILNISLIVDPILTLNSNYIRFSVILTAFFILWITVPIILRIPPSWSLKLLSSSFQTDYILM